MIGRCLRHRAPVLWLLLPFMGGIIAGKIAPWSLPVGWLLGGAVAAALAAIVTTNKTPSARPLVALCAAVFLSGTAAYDLRRTRLDTWESLPPREARLTLHIERTFPAQDTREVSGLAVVTAADPHLRDLVGQRLYYSLTNKSRTNAPIRSAEINVIGLLETLPRSAPLATFDGYLTAAGLNFHISRGLMLAETRPAGRYARFCENARERFGAILSLGLEKQPPLAGALRAMMLGQKHELADAQTEQFLQSGTMHLFAISGLHIAAIAVALHGLLVMLRLPRVARFVVGLVALWLYVDITGGSPSAVRAFLMIALVQSAFVLRLPVNAVATLALAALINLCVDPMQLFSASFQMSYGIVASIVLLGLPLAETWTTRYALFRDLPKATWSWHHRLRDKAWHAWINALAIGLATTLVSTICGVVFFQLFTPGGLVANLVLIPISTLVIWSGFLSLLLGLLGLAPLAAIFNHAAALVLALMETSIAWLLKIPGFFWPLRFDTEWAGFVSLGVLIAAMLFGYANRWELKRGGFWTPFALTALALVLVARFG